MKCSRFIVIVAALTLMLVAGSCSLAQAETTSPYAQWSNGPSTDPGYFPLAVWLQDPSTANQWKNAGMNLFVGLWQGPTMQQLSTLQAADMQVIAAKNSMATTAASMTLSDGKPLLVGWMQEDEPDNHPKTPPATIQNIYQDIKDFDTTRPVFMGLSQGMGWDNGTWIGQGGNINPAVDYPAYLAGTDIGAMDIYPMDCARAETCGDAWRPSLGVDRLYQYGGPDQLVWNDIETGDINGNGMEATVEEIKMEVWSSIIHGTKGIVYFIHGKTSVSNFDHKALLRSENADHLAGVTAINQEITSLAPVINSETLTGVATVDPSNPSMLVDFMVKEYDNATYVFATGMRDLVSVADFSFLELGDATIDVLGEDRQIQMVDGEFSDVYFGFDTHLYRINAIASPLVGDFDGSGIVDGGDLAIWQMGYGTTSGAATSDGDADGDFDVDGSDFLLWQQHTANPASFSIQTVVPEPSTFAMLFVGSTLQLLWRRKCLKATRFYCSEHC